VSQHGMTDVGRCIGNVLCSLKVFKFDEDKIYWGDVFIG